MTQPTGGAPTEKDNISGYIWLGNCCLPLRSDVAHRGDRLRAQQGLIATTLNASLFTGSQLSVQKTSASSACFAAKE